MMCSSVQTFQTHDQWFAYNLTVLEVKKTEISTSSNVANTSEKLW
jgi:hypothetical protein